MIHCPECSGTGRNHGRPCRFCAGRKKVTVGVLVRWARLHPHTPLSGTILRWAAKSPAIRQED